MGGYNGCGILCDTVKLGGIFRSPTCPIKWDAEKFEYEVPGGFSGILLGDTVNDEGMLRLLSRPAEGAGGNLVAKISDSMFCIICLVSCSFFFSASFCCNVLPGLVEVFM